MFTLIFAWLRLKYSNSKHDDVGLYYITIIFDIVVFCMAAAVLAAVLNI